MIVYNYNGKSYKLPGNLSDFQTKMYLHLIEWKWNNITKEPGEHLNIDYDAILPNSIRPQFPLIYASILRDLIEHQKLFNFKFHKHFNHMASSQAANINLFLPILLHPRANEILRRIKQDFKCLAKNELYKGFRIEFWDGISQTEKGTLNDHSPFAGTDADMAIAYLNHDDEICLWLIEHKLTEKEFTGCGGAKSKGRTNIHDCNKTFTEILENKNLCYYHSKCQFRYWEITERNRSFFSKTDICQTCPFKGGMNQLWRNQLLGLALENAGIYRQSFFSVVYHPENYALLESISKYHTMTGENPKFSAFTSRDIIKIVHQINDPELNKWSEWYTGLYNI